MISLTASLVPKIRANIPKMKTRRFFHKRNRPGPKPMSQNVAISMIAGAMRPRREKQKAPMTPMKGAMVGTATASITHIVTIMVLIT